MGRGKSCKKLVDSYTIRGSNQLVKVNDTVLMRNEEPTKPSYVAKIEKMWIDRKNNVKVEARWYYRPEESISGRRQFHGAKEVFLSDHVDVQSADTIEGKCYVHTFKGYTQLKFVEPEDYFCRFEYKATTGAFKPETVTVYCTCEMPYNPDDVMGQCKNCKEWFHPSCIGLNIEQVRNLQDFFCSNCQNDMNKELRSQHSQPPAAKVQNLGY